MMKVLKFYADWCQPCKMLSKIIEGAKDKITLPIEEINIDDNQELAQQYGIRGIPLWSLWTMQVQKYVVRVAC